MKCPDQTTVSSEKNADTVPMQNMGRTCPRQVAEDMSQHGAHTLLRVMAWAPVSFWVGHEIEHVHP